MKSKISLFLVLGTFTLHAAEKPTPPGLPTEITNHIKSYLCALSHHEGQRIFRCPSIEDIQMAVGESQNELTINSTLFTIISYGNIPTKTADQKQPINITFEYLGIGSLWRKNQEPILQTFHCHYPSNEAQNINLGTEGIFNVPSYNIVAFCRIPVNTHTYSVQNFIDKEEDENLTVLYTAPKPENLIITCLPREISITPEKFLMADQFSQSWNSTHISKNKPE